MKKSVTNALIWVGLFVACLAFSIALSVVGNNHVAAAPIRKKQLSGETVNAVSIADVQGVMQLTAANYLPDKFAQPDEVVSDQYDGLQPARRGTYRFYIDTLTVDEWAQRNKLVKLLQPDGNWHLTMYIPPVFAACSVLVQWQSVQQVGEIDRYNIDYYINYSAPDEFDDAVSHSTATQPIFVDIPISANDAYTRECIVTIHYEATNDNFVGPVGQILIGEDAAVRNTVVRNSTILLIGAFVGAGTLLIFLLICILKRSFNFIPQLLYAAGIFVLMISTYSMFGYTSVPYLLLGFRRFTVGFMLLASAMYLPKKIGRAHVLYPTIAAASVATVLAFVSPFCTSVAAHATVCYIYMALAAACIVVIYGCTLRDICLGKPLGLRLNTVIVGVSTVTALFATQSIPLIAHSPAFWLYFAQLGITLVLGLREFSSAEIHNRLLTVNLEQEVARQTQSLQNVLAERDKILMYVSHDMKKTAVRMSDSLTDLRQHLSEPELAAKVDLILQKNAELKNDFAEIGKYGRQNYVAEQSEEVNIAEIVRGVTDDLRPDCEANGIVLTVAVPETLDVYAKKAALTSVLQNLVLNAIEHSFCTHLSVTAAKRRGMCRIEVTDDGQGITTDKNVFDPFVSGSDYENNSGLGLFLAKNAIETMHGELSYERKDGLTIFAATLPLA